MWVSNRKPNYLPVFVAFTLSVDDQGSDTKAGYFLFDFPTIESANGSGDRLRLTGAPIGRREKSWLV